MLGYEPIEADGIRAPTHQSTSDPDTNQPALRHRTNMKNKFEVNLEDVPSGEIVKSTLQVGKYDVKDEVDIMVDALQLKS